MVVDAATVAIRFSYIIFTLHWFPPCAEKNKKRDIRNWYQSANDRFNDGNDDKNRDAALRRGDIPILHGDCDGMWNAFETNDFHHNLLNVMCVRSLIAAFHNWLFTDIISKAIQDLLALVKLLREEVAHQTNEINHLRRLIENCAGCREPAPIVKENCDNANPCFTGVQCYDTSTGIRCGRCPSGKLLKDV